jgi:hypothetical protein
MVFIGKDLDHDALRASFNECFVGKAQPETLTAADFAGAN